MRLAPLVVVIALAAGCTAGWSAYPGASGRDTVTISVDVYDQHPPSVLALTCAPPGGTHPWPEAACASLRRFVASLDAGRGAPDARCGIDGFRIVVRGRLDGAPVRFSSGVCGSGGRQRDLAVVATLRRAP